MQSVGRVSNLDHRAFDRGAFSTSSTRGIMVIVLFALAFLLRSADFGNAAIDLDEQWYLLVGDRMLHGAVPYIDMWDRKPVGLFLSYAALRILPGDGIIAYEVVATLFAGATAVTVAAIARRIGANAAGALAGGLLYLLALSVLGGQGGQAPVFYNLPVALAALLTTRLPEFIASGRPSTIGWNGLAACGLVGLAIQLKYTAAVEGAFIGIAHLWAAWQLRERWSLPAIFTWTLAWAIAGLLPTIVAVMAFAGMGTKAFEAFWFANFVSILLRNAYPTRQVLGNLGSIIGQLVPLLLAAGVTMLRYRTTIEASRERALASGWLLAAGMGFVAIGTFHDHYALPLLAPLATLGGVALGRSRYLLAIAIGAASLIFVGERMAMADANEPVREAAHLVRAWSHDRCPYIFMGDPIIYHLAESCIPTAYAFPNTLAQAIEQGATGVDEATEVARIMAGHPPVVVLSDRRRTIWNHDSVAVMRRALARDYCLARRIRRGRWNLLLYVRRHGANGSILRWRLNSSLQSSCQPSMNVPTSSS